MTVETATSAEAGLDRLESGNVDCIVSDYDMPGMNGIEFLDTVRTEDPDIPFILFTGKGSEEVASEAISAGVTDYRQKESGTDQYAILANRIANAVERAEFEDVAAETQAQLRAISQHSADAIVVMSATGTVLFANPAVEDHLGYDPDALVGEPLTTIIPPRLEAAHEAAVERYLATGERTLDWSAVEFPGHHADGEDVPLSISFSEFERDGDQRFIAIMRDVSDRVAREQALREKQAELLPYARAVESSTDLLAAVDTDYNLLFANEQYQRYHGLESADLTGMALPDLFGERWEGTVKGRVDRSLDGETIHYEMERTTPEGAARTLDINYYPLRSEDGSIIGAVAAMRDLTEMKHEQREREKIIDRVTDAIVEVDAEWRFTLVNEQAEALYGMAAADLLGEDFWEVFASARDTRFEDEYRAVMQTREPTEFTEHFPMLEGWFDIEVYPNDDGGLSFYFRDVTDRIERERDLRRKDQIVREMNDGALIVQDDRIKYANPRVATLLGREQDTLPGMSLSEFIAEDQLETVLERHHGRTEGTGEGPPDVYESAVVTATGERIPVEISATQITYDDRPAALALVRDISERMQRERELKRQRALLEAQQETILDGILVVDETGEMVSYNDRFVEMWKVPPAVVEGGEEAAALEYATEQLANPEEFHEKVEYLYEHVDETARDEIELTDGRIFDRYTAPMIGEDGTYFGRLWTFRDITNRIEQETELRRQNERLERFASIVSHDLRNPLNVAQARVQMAREEHDSEHLEAAERAYERTFALIEDLLTLARQGAGVTDVEPIPLATIATECWENVETEAASLDVRTDQTVRADRNRLQQLLENLFRNAVEHGGSDVTVTVEAIDGGFCVDDDGAGIPPEHREDVFESGYSTRTEGTGFGLSIVKQIAETHGWDLAVVEGTDGGARFEFTGVQFD